MKARLLPVHFSTGQSEEFTRQLGALRGLLREHADILDPVSFGAVLPEADAVLFPEVLGEAYRRLDDFRTINVPILLITSEFGTLSMWDWEIAGYFRAEGITY